MCSLCAGGTGWSQPKPQAGSVQAEHKRSCGFKSCFPGLPAWLRSTIRNNKDKRSHPLMPSSPYSQRLYHQSHAFPGLAKNGTD